MNLSQDEARILIAIEKYLLEQDNIITLPLQGKHKIYSLEDLAHKEKFHLSMYLGAKNIRKITYQLMYQGRIILLRVDIGYSGTHFNPDGTIIGPGLPHIHIYNENYADRIAYPLPPSFTDPNDFITALYDFMEYSNVINRNELQIQTGLDFNDS